MADAAAHDAAAVRTAGSGAAGAAGVVRVVVTRRTVISESPNHDFGDTFDPSIDVVTVVTMSYNLEQEKKKLKILIFDNFNIIKVVEA